MKITITDKAIEKIHKINNNRSKLLLLQIEAGGCSGLSYDFSLADCNAIHEEHHVIYDGEIPIFAIEKKFLPYVENALIDYKSDILESKFMVEKNEMAAANCGCGTSFQPKNFA